MRFDVEAADIREVVQRALAEDIGTGDVTSRACVPEARRASGRFVAREPIVLAGIELLPLIYQLRGGLDELKLLKTSGDCVGAGDVVAAVRGARTRCSNASAWR